MESAVHAIRTHFILKLTRLCGRLTRLESSRDFVGNTLNNSVSRPNS